MSCSILRAFKFVSGGQPWAAAPRRLQAGFVSMVVDLLPSLDGADLLTADFSFPDQGGLGARLDSSAKAAGAVAHYAARAGLEPAVVRQRLIAAVSGEEA